LKANFTRFISVLSLTVLSVLLFWADAQTAKGAHNDGCTPKHWDFPVNTYWAPQIYRQFDKNLGKYAAGHRGLDLYAEVGTNIIAPVDGELLWKGVVANKPTVTFKSGEFKLTFEPAVTDLAVGTPVAQGEKLGAVSEYRDASQHCDRSCLHWGVLRGDDNYLDPLERVYKKRIVLKPL
jgi:hypothetical protein